MFPTDQQKRLQVVNSSNPSLRAAAAPFSLQGGNFSLQGVNNTAAPQLPSNMRLGPVQVAHPGNLQVGNQTIVPGNTSTNARMAVPTVNPLIQGLRSVGNFGVSGAKGFAAPFQYLLNTDIVDPTRELYNQATGDRLGYQNAVQQSNENLGLGANGRNWKGGLERLGGNAAQIGLDVAAPGVAKFGSKLAGPLVGNTVGRVAPGLVESGTRLVGGSLAGAPIGAAFNLSSAAANNTLSKKNALHTAGQGAELGALFGGPLDVGVNAAASGIKRVFSTPSEQTQFVNYLSKEKDPNAIHDVLSHIYGGTSDAIKQVSADIANSPNKKFIIRRLADLPEEAGAAAIGSKVIESAVETNAARAEQARALAKKRAEPQGNSHSIQDIDFGTVDPNILPPGEEGAALRAKFTPAEQQVLKDAGVDVTPAYQRGVPKTVGQAAAQAKAGVFNVGDEVFNADKRVNQMAEPGSTPKVDVPSYIKRDPRAAVTDASANLQRIDSLLSKIGSQSSAQFNARQELANELRANPGNRQAILAKYERSKTVYDPSEVQKTTNELLAERQKYQKVINLAKEAQAPEAAVPVPEPPAITKEAIAAQSTPRASAPGAPEGVANSVETQPGGLAEAINKAADEGITKLPTGLPKHTNAVQRTFLSVSGELSKMGESGKAIANGLKAARDTSETGQAWFIKQIPSVLKLKGKDFTDFVDTLEGLSKGGGMESVPPKIAQAVQEWTAAIPQVRDIAAGVGVDVGDLGPHYFPRNYTELLKDQASMNRLANDLVKSGQAANVGEALQQLRFMKRQYSSKFGHFENSRKIDLPGYDKSRNALISYVEGAFNKIGSAEQFGPKGEQASQLVAQLGSEGHDVERASRLLKIANGTEEYNQPGVETASNAIRAFNRTTKLGLSAILNAGQTANTVAAGGIGRTLKNSLKYVSKNDRDFVDATGVNADSVLSNLREQTGIAGKITGKITAPGFNAVEKFNRGTATLVGRDTANMLAEKAAQGNARAAESLRVGFGIDEVPPSGVLEPGQQIQAARNFVERTQFKVDPQDLPAWANSPLGKMAAQFRTFSYKQQKFIQDEVLKQAMHGNVQPLIRFIAVGAPIGLATSTVRGALRGQPATQVKGNQDNPTTSAIGKFVDALNNAGGFGMGSSALFPVQNVKSARFPQYLASSVLGPTAGLAVQTATNTQQAAAGSPKAAERQGLSAIPIVGPFIANKTVPYKPSNKALAKAGDTSSDTQGGFANFVGNQNGQKITTADFVKTLSPKDRQYFQVTKGGKTISVSQSMLDAAHAAGQLSDEQYRYASSLHDVYDRTNAQGKLSTLPANLDPTAKQYYDLTGKLDKRVVADFKAGKNQNPILTKMVGQVADTLNKQLPTGIKNLKPSPQLLDEYAKYQKAQAQAAQDGKPWDDLTTRTKLRGFWSTAIKGSQDQQVQEIYKQSATQLKDYFIKNKKVSTDDIMKAIGLDDALFNADLIDSPHFSKSFRKTFGVGMPNSYTTGSGSGGGSGSGSGTRQYVTIGGKKYAITAAGTPVQVTGSDGQTKVVRVNAQGMSSGPTGLSSLVPNNLSFKTPTINTTPQKLSFKVNLPTDVRGNPRPQRVASMRYTTVRLK